MFNNETRQYDYCNWIMDADWFDDAQGFLFIVPQKDVVAEIEGPDGPILDAMNAACQDHGEITEEDCTRLGLTRVSDILKRFSPEDGYYHA
jgi:hypothetical protein